MIFGNFSYVATILIFAGGAVAMEYLLGVSTFSRYRKPIVIAVFLGLFYTTLGEPVALAWQVWVYNPSAILNIYLFGSDIETYLYVFFITIAIGIAATEWAEYEEEGLPLIGTTFKKARSGLKRFEKKALRLLNLYA